ncbi:MAG: DegT/DnrJ/EryC1/StrS family aminotransferase [Candidatus Diapherotrites archaeon]|nr:DegT/DnrJ/EryC1/StrS family aminotransferase [Candidatus Diapherotrites archaeon]
MIQISKPITGEEEKKAVCDVLDSAWLAQGPRVKEFEDRFAAYCGAKHAVATTNGTQALILALHAAKIDGEVLVPSFTFAATATTVKAVGAKPVFVEVDEKTFNMDAEDARKKITDKTTAIMPVHLYGQCCDMDAFRELAEDKDLTLIEDACQAHGAEFRGRKAGSMGDLACFSFYPTKNMTSVEGGMILTDDAEKAEGMRLFRNQGQTRKYWHEYEGYNFRMTEVHAAVGLEQLKKLDAFNKARRKNAAFYDDALKSVETPFVDKRCTHVYHQYTIKTRDRDALVKALEAAGIGYGMFYPIPAHKQPVIGSSASLPITEKLAQEVISIPVHPAITEEDLHAVAKAVNSTG